MSDETSGNSDAESGDRRIKTASAPLLLTALIVGAVALALWASLAISRQHGIEESGADSDPQARLDPRAPTEQTATASLSVTSYSVVAAYAATDTVGIFESPTSAEPALRLSRTNEHGAPQTFLVQEFQKGWAKVMLPTPPAGSTGWIKTSDVEFYGIDYMVRVRLASKRLEVWNGGRLLLSFAAGIGRRDTPTPGGTYYIKELLKPEDPSGPWGTYAYGLNGYSNSVYRPSGEPGVIGIHGTNEPDSVGKEVSAGCVRLRNEDIEKLVDLLPLGTPVEIIDD
jgi:lipoprotein-anchoring transpeptidase ErfK/SrfK